MVVFDAHAHAGDPAELETRRRFGVRTMLSCGNVQQAEAVSALCEREPLFSMTAGVHPWYAGTTPLCSMEPYMLRAALVGEIGMDCVWCDTPLPIQRECFLSQLAWARAHGKGVVLHTKGCEDEIAQLISGFPHPVVVHWYSGGDEALARFLSQGCYFTLGPDVPENVARVAPDDRILFETDGMDAVRWALGDVETGALPHVLESSVQKAAALRHQDAAWLAETANRNFKRLLTPSVI